MAAFAFLIAGCEGGKGTATIPELKQLYADSIKTPPVLLSVTSLFTVGEDTLGIYQQRDDTLFSFWKLPECRFLFKAGIQGQGPNDFGGLDKTFQGKAGGFRAYEIQTGRVKDVTVGNDGSLNVASKKIDVGQMMNRFIFLENDTYCFFLMQNDKEFGLYNEKDGLRYIGEYPDLITKKNDELDVFVYNKVTVAHPDGSKFAAFYAYLKMCRIFGSDGTLLKEVYLEGPVEQEEGRRKAYYSMQPCASGESIYILTNGEEGKVLEVWNWKAEIVGRYLVDKDFDKYVVHEGKLFGFSRTQENVVYVYDLR